MVDRTMPALLRSLRNRVTSLERRLARGAYSLPDRLGPQGAQINDWNDAVLPGFYWGVNALNGPVGQAGQPSVNWTMGIVRWHSGDSGGYRVSQEVREARAVNSAVLYTRYASVLDGVIVSPQPWREERPGAPMRGPGSERSSVRSGYWQFWQDTDGDQALYVGNKSGGWRRFSGKAVNAETGWASTSGTTIAGRTNVFTLPTTLESNETLLVQIDPSVTTSGYNFVGVTDLVRNPTNTQVNVRFMQLMSLTTQPMPIVWQIVQF